MKKSIKKIALYSSTLLFLSIGVKAKICKEKSKDFTNQVIEYTNNFEDDNFSIAAHRGFSSLAVENSIESISLAAKTDYIDYIEIDARLTKDFKIVLSHNNSILTSSQQKLEIEKEKYDTLKNNCYSYISNSLSIKLENLFNKNDGDIFIERSKNLESNKYDIISLKEGIKACKNKNILLDLKFEDNTENFINALDKELEQCNKDNIIFQSDDLLPLLCLQKRHPDYNYLAIIKTKNDLDYIPLFDYVGIRKNLITEELVDSLLEQDKKVAIWTLNKPSEINRTIKKVGKNYKDIIYISDYPDIVGCCLNNQEKRLKK